MDHPVNQLVNLIHQGKFLEAFDEFYADGIEMSENGNAPMVGKQANRDREVNFIATIANLHYYKAEQVLIDGDFAVIHWLGEYTGTDGNVYRWDQFAVQEWKDGQIIRERFNYDPTSLLVKAA